MPKKQQDLPAIEGEGVAPKKIPAVEKAADKYVEIRDKRMAMTEQEVTARAGLIEMMHEHKLTVYTYDDYKITMEPREKIKVRTVAPEPVDED